MARVSGVDIPDNKRGEIGLTYIFGIGRRSAQHILTKAGIGWDKKVGEWTDEESNAIRSIITEEFKVEGVLKSEVQFSIIEAKETARHVQLKASFRGSRTASQKLHLQLGKKESGCVVWIQFDPESLDLGPFLWFGGGPGQKLPSLSKFKVAKHTKGDATGKKAERPMIRVVPKSKFEKLSEIEEVLARLFG